MPKNLIYDNRNACCVPYDSPTPGLTRQLRVNWRYDVAGMMEAVEGGILA